MKDPKVGYVMGKRGAPADATNRLDLLLADYCESGKTLTPMEFNGAMLDIEPPVVSKDFILEGGKAKIQHIVNIKLINKARGLYKTGLIAANARVVLEVVKQVVVLEEKAKANKELKKQNDAH